MFTSIQDSSPKIGALFMELHLNTKCTQWDHYSPYILSKHQSCSRKAIKCNTNFKERSSTQCRIASPRIVQEHNKGIIAFPKTRKHKTKFEQSKRIQKVQGRHKRVKTTTNPRARNKAILTNVNMINKFTTTMIVTCQRQGMYGDISRWQMAKIYP